MAEKQYFLEGAFRRLHVRLRTHAESVAFFGGGAREGRTVNNSFQQLQVGSLLKETACCPTRLLRLHLLSPPLSTSPPEKRGCDVHYL